MLFVPDGVVARRFPEWRHGCNVPRRGGLLDRVFVERPLWVVCRGVAVAIRHSIWQRGILVGVSLPNWRLVDWFTKNPLIDFLGEFLLTFVVKVLVVLSVP